MASLHQLTVAQVSSLNPGLINLKIHFIIDINLVHLYIKAITGSEEKSNKYVFFNSDGLELFYAIEGKKSFIQNIKFITN